MTVINSVLGPLETSELGFSLTHEHVWQSAAGINNTHPEFFTGRMLSRGLSAC